MALTLKVKDKIDYVLDIIKHVEQVPIKFLKHMEGTDGLFEIRVKTTFKKIRIFCFFDQANIIILTNCIEKKSQKTPKDSLGLGIQAPKITGQSNRVKIISEY